VQKWKPGYIIVPGASGPIEGDPDEIDTIPVLLARFGETAAIPLMREAVANPDVTVATVCGGSLALAMAGLLDGRNGVTHVLGLEVLEATGVNVLRARVVDNGDREGGSQRDPGRWCPCPYRQRTAGACEFAWGPGSFPSLSFGLGDHPTRRLVSKGLSRL
jgi:hypothetical protein